MNRKELDKIIHTAVRPIFNFDHSITYFTHTATGYLSVIVKDNTAVLRTITGIQSRIIIDDC